MGQDKRRHERIEINDSRHVHNISVSGMYVKTDEPRRLGSIVHFETKLDPDLPCIKGQGRVIRALYQKGGKSGLPPGIALEFIEISPLSQEIIVDFMKLKKARDRLSKAAPGKVAIAAIKRKTIVKRKGKK